MQECSRCGKVKSLNSFTNKTKTKKQKICKDCMNLQSRSYRSRMTALIGRWKVMKGCSNPSCQGHPNHRAALHLAHLKPKMGEWKHSGAYKPWWSKSRIKQELAKCRVLCANCHSVETYEEEHYMLGNNK